MNPRPSIGEGNLNTSKSNQTRQLNSVQDPTEFNLDIENMDSPGG